MEDGLAYEYEMDDAMAYGKIMATSMPLMNAPMPMPEFNTEEYADIRENGFKSVRTSPHRRRRCSADWC